MAIKAHELRIGNLVFDHLGRVQTVAETRADAYICYLSNGAKLKYKLNTTNPIPLTEEWLLKFGFQKKQTDRYLSISLVVDNMKFIYSEWIFMFGVEGVAQYHYTRTKIEYVHQLQNLFFSLCGEELNVK